MTDDDRQQPTTGAPEPGSAAASSRAPADRIDAGALRASGEPIDEPRAWPRPEGSGVASFGPTSPTPEPPAPERHSRWPLIIAAASAAVALIALAVTGYFAYTNKVRADDWEQRAVVLERNVDELNVVLVERSNTLNARTRELNRIAATVKRQQRALRRSEADVSSLSARQRALAAEKAEVEDERAALAVQAAALENVADALLGCNDGLIRLLGYVLDEDYFSAQLVIGDVVSDCQYAESALSSYSGRYG